MWVRQPWSPESSLSISWKRKGSQWPKNLIHTNYRDEENSNVATKWSCQVPQADNNATWLRYWIRQSSAILAPVVQVFRCPAFSKAAFSHGHEWFHTINGLCANNDFPRACALPAPWPWSDFWINLLFVFCLTNDIVRIAILLSSSQLSCAFAYIWLCNS